MAQLPVISKLEETLRNPKTEQSSSKVRSNSIGAALSSLVKRGTSPWKTKEFSIDNITLAIEEQQLAEKYRANSADSPNYQSPLQKSNAKLKSSYKRNLSTERSTYELGTRTSYLDLLIS